MKTTFTPAQVATITTCVHTAHILGPLMAAAAQTMRLGDKTPASRPTGTLPQGVPQPASKKRPTGPIHRIIQGECLAMMAKIPDRSIDFICADFPYNISGKGGLTMRNDQIVKADFGEWDKFPSEEAYFEFVFNVCDQYRRILKPNASMVLFFGYRHAGWIAHELQRRGLFTFRMPLIWVKDNPMPSVKKTTFRSAYEMGLWLINDGGTFASPRDRKSVV